MKWVLREALLFFIGGFIGTIARISYNGHSVNEGTILLATATGLLMASAVVALYLTYRSIKWVIRVV